MACASFINHRPDGTSSDRSVRPTKYHPFVPEAAALQSERRRFLYGAITEVLTPQERTVILLRYADMSLVEIGEALNLSKGQVWHVQAAAHAKMRTYLEARGIRSSEDLSYESGDRYVTQ